MYFRSTAVNTWEILLSIQSILVQATSILMYATEKNHTHHCKTIIG